MCWILFQNSSSHPCFRFFFSLSYPGVCQNMALHAARNPQGFMWKFFLRAIYKFSFIHYFNLSSWFNFIFANFSVLSPQRSTVGTENEVQEPTAIKVSFIWRSGEGQSILSFAWFVCCWYFYHTKISSYLVHSNNAHKVTVGQAVWLKKKNEKKRKKNDEEQIAFYGKFEMHHISRAWENRSVTDFAKPIY